MSGFSQRSPDKIVECCPEDCKGNWSRIDGEIQRIEKIKDPRERNKAITGKYKEIAEMNPENRWARLASYVSAQAGCGMERTDDADAQTLGRVFVNPEDAKKALADGNITIFKSVARPFLYVNTYGYDSLDHCLESAPQPPIPNELVKAMRIMQEGELRRAADMIAEHEQVDVVEKVYERHQETFADIDSFDTSRWDFFDTTRDRQSIPLSHDCTNEDRVPLDGPLSVPKNRVKYYHKLMNELEAMEDWE